MLKAVHEFLRMEAAAGIVLALAAAAALVLANTPLAPFYDRLIDTPVTVQVGALVIAKPLLLWINDGLMAVFFFLVGLEIKREVLEGELSSPARVMLPGIAAVGGMVIPAGIYVLINAGNPALLRGWAIPAATDIAFALGVLALLGNRVPASLKVFLLALAIIDDLGAIVIIALFYAADLSLPALTVAGVATLVLVMMNTRGVGRLTPYVLVGIVLWVSVLKSGVHATLAGVVLALTIPLRLPDHRASAEDEEEAPSPLTKAWHALHPWVAYGILPTFAFANAGVSMSGLSLADLARPLPLGIAAGLFIGKQAGVMLFSLLATRLRLAELPPAATLMQFYGVSLLTGIGFTMSLFIGALAFEDTALAADVRIGVLTGSLLSAVAGYLVLVWAVPAQRRASGDDGGLAPRLKPTVSTTALKDQP